MNKEIESLRIDLDELAKSVEQNRRDRLAYIDFKVKWMREHGQIIPPDAPADR